MWRPRTNRDILHGLSSNRCPFLNMGLTHCTAWIDCIPHGCSSAQLSGSLNTPLDLPSQFQLYIHCSSFRASTQAELHLTRRQEFHQPLSLFFHNPLTQSYQLNTAHPSPSTRSVDATEIIHVKNVMSSQAPSLLDSAAQVSAGKMSGFQIGARIG